MKEDILTIKNEQGEEKEYDIIFSFKKNNKEYVTYTDYQHDENNNIKCYSNEYDNGQIKPIKDEDVLKNIEELLKTITETTKKRYSNIINKEDKK